jgi:hypothetical protein
MARNIKNLGNDIARALRNVGYQEALLIVDTTLEEMDNYIDPNIYDTGHLADSGFGYVNGKLVKMTDAGRDTGNLPITEPEITPISAGEGHYAITISYHTPRPWKKGPNGYFDYAPYVLEPPGGYSGFVRSSVFQSRRQAAYKGLMKSSHFDNSRLRAAIERGIQRGITLAGRRIAYKLSEL